MIVAFSGSRGIKGEIAIELIEKSLNSCGWRSKITKILHGDAEGIDQAAEKYCRRFWPVEAQPADWRKHGRSAGVVRNLEMVGKVDAVIAIWDGVSPGTKQMIEAAKKVGLPVFVHMHTKSGMKGFDL